MSELEQLFDERMMEIYRRANSEANYNATRFLQMLMDNRGVETARILLNAANVSDGYTSLWERNRLDLTVEAVILDHEEFHVLFSDEELETARQRLEDYGYTAPIIA